MEVTNFPAMTTPTAATRREAVRIGNLWKFAAAMEMSDREIICLQDQHTPKEIAAMFNLTTGRIYQIRGKAIRKMRSPMRIRLAVELGLADKIGLTEEQRQKVLATSLEDAIERYRYKFSYKHSREPQPDEED